jgi:hypothetical protein
MEAATRGRCAHCDERVPFPITRPPYANHEWRCGCGRARARYGDTEGDSGEVEFVGLIITGPIDETPIGKCIQAWLSKVELRKFTEQVTYPPAAHRPENKS